ncbi:hypothetical protein PsorP6_017334 [Peronosclerospora sorghi]|uniref:Uncharacterized protein n=1 Tax=Peronosclerospora sorghi TaxID=230839 RepID=A0ACC0WMZ8_9STRA|nr:hypothetical protein PsorP6_017334 [Peronosclerospora sorghi]
MLVNFLNGRGDTVSVVDPNHVAKAVRSQLILGSNIVLTGDYLVDPGLLPAANFSKELYQVTDYTSDLLVNRLCSPLSLQILAGVVECQNQVSMVAPLGFIQVNPDLLHLVCDDVVYVTHWYPLDDSVKLGDLGNCMVCLIIPSDVLKNRFTTSEPAEQMFGLLRQWSREFSVSDLLTLSRNLDEILRFSFESDIRSSREGLKGYQALFPRFVASVQAMLHSRDKKKDSVTAGGSSVAEDVIPSEADDEIKVDRSGVESVAEQTDTALLQLLNLTIKQMQNLLNRAGFEAMSPNSPLMRNFSTLKDLAKELVKYMRRTYKYTNEAEDEVSAPTADDVCESGDEEKSSPSSRDSIRQVVDVAQGILTGSPKEYEAVVFPSVQSRPTEGASETFFLTFAAEHLRVFWMSVLTSGAIQLSLLKPLKRWEDRKCLPEVVRLWLYRKQRDCRVDGKIREISALMGTTAAAARSLPPILGEEWCSYMDMTVTSSVHYSARPTESGGW